MHAHVGMHGTQAMPELADATGYKGADDCEREQWHGCSLQLGLGVEGEGVGVGEGEGEGEGVGVGVGEGEGEGEGER